jgi:hypothetical protein
MGVFPVNAAPSLDKEVSAAAGGDTFSADNHVNHTLAFFSRVAAACQNEFACLAVIEFIL